MPHGTFVCAKIWTMRTGTLQVPMPKASGVSEHLTGINSANLIDFMVRNTFSFQHINEGIEDVGISDTAAFIIEFRMPAAVGAEEKVFKIAALD